MKIFKLTLFTALVLALFSCEVEDSQTPNPSYTGNSSASNQSNGSMSAKVDGTNWKATKFSASILNGVINVTGIAANQSLVTFTLFDKGEGTYSFKNVQDGNGVYQVSQTESYNAGDTVGTVVISEINTSTETISGTFSFVGINFSSGQTRNISEGVFTDISYATAVAPVGNNSLKADIDGSTFTATSVNGGIALNKLSISGTDSQASETVGFHLPEDITVGIYPLGDIFSDYVGQYNRSSNEFLEATSGEINITLHDKTAKKIEGTFYFSASQLLVNDSASVTNGSFSTTY